MRILISGGCGFIGSAACRRFTSRGDTVVNIDKMTYAATLGSTASLPNYTHIKADITDVAALQTIFEQHRPEAVLHLAAESHVDRSIDGPGAFVQTNLVGTFAVLEAARSYSKGLPSPAAEAFRFIHVSTDEVYGSLGEEGLFDEETPYAPTSPYSASKAGSDHLAMAWGHSFGLPVILSNCSNNYGPFQFPEKLIPLITLNALVGRPLPVYGNGGNIRDWLHVDDHVSALERLLERGRPGEKYNIGSRSERTNLEVVEEICAIVDRLRPTKTPRRELIRHVRDRPGHDHRYAIDPRKMERELGWAPRWSFEDGLEETVRWYLENEAWWAPLRASAEMRLGLSATVMRPPAGGLA